MNGTVIFDRILKFHVNWWNSILIQMNYFYVCWTDFWIMLGPFWSWVLIIVAALIFFLGWTIFVMYFVLTKVFARNEAIPTKSSPFTIRVDRRCINFPGVRCKFASRGFCYVLPFWGVTVTDFFQLMNMNWSTMKQSLLEDGPNCFKNRCIAADNLLRLGAGERKEKVFMPPPSVYIDERMYQELSFHLVIVMLFMEDSIPNPAESFVFAQAAIIKVPAIYMMLQRRSIHREPNFPHNVTRVPDLIASYVSILNPNNRVDIERIYDATVMKTEVIDDVEFPACVTCNQRVINTVIFPCLHSLVCSLCHKKCNVCPSCKGPTSRFILLGPDIEIP